MAPRSTLLIQRGLALLAAAGLVGDEPPLRFSPAPGQVLAKHYKLQRTIELDDLQWTVGGEDLLTILGTPEILIDSVSEFTFVDEYVDVKDGRPRDFVREFPVANSDSEYGFVVQGLSETVSYRYHMPIKDHRVVFRYDEQTGEYEREFDPATPGPNELLHGLEEETGLRAALPPGTVTEGDSWEVSNRFLLQLISPGGYLGFDPEGLSLEAAGEQQLDEFRAVLGSVIGNGMGLYSKLLPGDSRAVHAGVIERRGRPVTRIRVDVEVESGRDLVAPFEQALNTALHSSSSKDLPANFSLDLERADLEYSIFGEVTVYWDHELGLLAGADATLDWEAEFAIEMVVGLKDESLEVEAVASFSIPHEIVVRTAQE